MPPKITSARRVLAMKRREMALALRLQGYTYHEIGKRLKISHMAAWNHVHAAMLYHKDKMAEDAGKIRDMEVSRLDAMLEKLFPRRQDPRVADTILRLMDRRSKLLGLDVPNKVDVNVTGLEKLSDEELLKQASKLFKKAGGTVSDAEGEGDGDAGAADGAEEEAE